MMPQKKNPDVFEMIRAKAADVMSLEERVKMIVKGLPSGYSRDLQEIKACIVDAYNITNNCLDVMSLALTHIEADSERINSVIQKDITSTDVIISQCIKQTGASFRDIYLNAGLDTDVDPLEAAMSRRSLGSPGKL
jgi:argininosuccinate lyase